jgi:hypothetical protein
LLAEALLDDPVLVHTAADLALKHFLIGGKDDLQKDILFTGSDKFDKSLSGLVRG